MNSLFNVFSISNLNLKFKVSIASAKPQVVPTANPDKNDNEAMYKQASVHFRLITSMKPSTLTLTKIDDEIFKGFREIFQGLDAT